MDLRRLKPIDWATGLFGAALVGLLWAPWYHASQGGITGAFFDRNVGAPEALGSAPPVVRVGFDAWQSMAVNDVILLIAGSLAIWVALATALNATGAMPIAAATFATWAGLIASLLALIRLIFPPDLGPGPTDRAAGVWLGAAAALGLTAGAALTMHDERRGVRRGTRLTITELPAPRVGEQGGGA